MRPIQFPIQFPVQLPFLSPFTKLFPSLGTRRRRIPFRFRQLTAPLTFWLVTIALALVTARIVERAAEPYPPEWGSLVDVVVVSQPIAAGQPIDASSVVVRSIPSVFAPKRSAPGIRSAAGRIPMGDLVVGAPVDLARTVPASTSEIVAAIGPGRRGVGLPLDAVPPGLRIGDHVDVLVASDGDSAVFRSVRNAQVVVLDDRGALVAMPADDAEQLTAARVVGRATLILVGG